MQIVWIQVLTCQCAYLTLSNPPSTAAQYYLSYNYVKSSLEPNFVLQLAHKILPTFFQEFCTVMHVAVIIYGIVWCCDWHRYKIVT